MFRKPHNPYVSAVVLLLVIVSSCRVLLGVSAGDLDFSLTPGLVWGTEFLDYGRSSLSMQDGSLLVIPSGWSWASQLSHRPEPSGQILQFTPEGIVRHFTETNFNFAGKLVADPDGTIILTGFPGAVRLDSMGRVDDSFTFPKYNLNDIVIGNDRKITVLTQYGWIGRFLPSGAPDAEFQFETPAMVGNISKIFVQSDGAVIAALGTLARFIRFTEKGAIDHSYSTPTFSFADPSFAIRALAIDSQDRLYVGGGITNVGGTPRSGIARLNKDGSFDPSFTVKWDVLNGKVGVNQILPFGERFILSAGTIEAGSNGGIIEVLNLDGTIDTSFTRRLFDSLPAVVGVAQNHVYYFGWTNQSASYGTLWRTSLRGVLDPTFNPLGPPWPMAVYARTNSLLSVASSGIQLLRTNGTPLTALKTQTSTIYQGCALDSTGKVLVFERQRITRYNSDGTVDGLFKAPTIGQFDGDYTGIYPRSNGKILVWGQFQIKTPVSRTNFLQLEANGTIDQSWLSPVRPFSTVGESPEGKVLVAAGSRLHSGDIQRLSSDGSIDATFEGPYLWWWNAGDYTPGGHVEKIAFLQDGSALVAGWFTGISRRIDQADEQQVTGLVKLLPNGDFDPTFIPAQITAPVWNVLPQPDGKILVVDGVSLLRLLPNGRVDNAFRTVQADGMIQSVANDPNGDIVIAGAFSSINGKDMPGVARIYANGVPTQPADPRLKQPTIALQLGPGQVACTVKGDHTSVFGIEESFDLVNWHLRKQGTNFPGQWDIVFPAPSQRASFYRAFVHN